MKIWLLIYLFFIFLVSCQKDHDHLSDEIHHDKLPQKKDPDSVAKEALVYKNQNPNSCTEVSYNTSTYYRNIAKIKDNHHTVSIFFYFYSDAKCLKQSFRLRELFPYKTTSFYHLIKSLEPGSPFKIHEPDSIIFLIEKNPLLVESLKSCNDSSNKTHGTNKDPGKNKPHIHPTPECVSELTDKELVRSSGTDSKSFSFSLDISSIKDENTLLIKDEKGVVQTLSLEKSASGT